MTKKVKTIMTKKQSPLIGKCFVVFDEIDGRIKWNWQGWVMEELNDNHFLVRYFSCFDGSPSTMAIFHIAEMKGSNPRKKNTWEFFENDEDLRYWMETWGK